MPKTVDIVGEAFGIMRFDDRHLRLKYGRRLASMIHANLQTTGEPIVKGEEGVPDWHTAVGQLVGNRSIQHIEAWMLAETVAAGAVAAHERATLEPVPDDRLAKLTDHLTHRALHYSEAAQPHRLADAL